MWAKVDDRLFSHPKVAQCSQSAMGLWVKALSWTVCYSTDGKVPRKSVAQLGARLRDARQLVEAGLWEETDDGFVFHDWADYMPTTYQSRQEAARISPESRPNHANKVKAGAAGGRKKAANRAKRLAEAVAEQQQTCSPVPSRPVDTPNGVSILVAQPVDDSPQLALVPSATAPADAGAKPSPSSRGTRLPDRWFPDRTPAALKLEAAHDHEWLQRELEKFSDYWQAKSGQQATKLDWTKTWCNWLRNAEDRHPRTRQQETDDWYARSQQRAAAGINVFAEMMKDAQK